MTARWDVLLAFAVGCAAGALGLVAWWARRLSKPEVVQKVLRDLYAKAHPHWLQVSEKDDAKVCPTCGWSEGRGHAARRELADEQLAAKRPG